MLARLLPLALACACSSEPTPPTDVPAETADTSGTADTGPTLDCSAVALGLELGGPEAPFAPIADGAVLEVRRVSPGNLYIAVGARVASPSPLVRGHVSVFDFATGAELGGAQAPVNLELEAFADCAGEVFDLRGFLDRPEDPAERLAFLCGLNGSEVEVVVALEGLDGGGSVTERVRGTAEVQADPEDTAVCG